MTTESNIQTKTEEPWLRGTLTEFPAAIRAVLHALESAKEDIERWCASLTDEELNARPSGLAPIAFHLRHMGRSADRLLTYAEGNSIGENQIAQLKAEMNPGATRSELFAELNSRFATNSARVRSFSAESLDEPRNVGRKKLPTSVGGLLVHVADHTQHHVGELIITSKVVLAQRPLSDSRDLD